MPQNTTEFKYIKSVKGRNYENLASFLDSVGVIIDAEFTDDGMLNFVGNRGVSNKQSIWDSYDDILKADYVNADSLLSKPLDRIPILPNTVITAPTGKVKRQRIFTGTNVVSENKRFVCFLGDEIQKIYNNPGFKPIEKTLGKNFDKGLTFKQLSRISVWIWCRALGSNSELINLTPYIQSCQTSGGDNGSNFNITLPPIIASCLCNDDPDKPVWSIKQEGIQKYSHNGQMNFAARGLVNHLDPKTKEFKRSQFYFHNIISSNDLIFIKFEGLEMENKRKREENASALDSFSKLITNLDLPNEYYDLIGLVDSNVESFSPESTDVSINIGGRDLSKMFIEDGVYFYPLEYVGGTPNGLFRYQTETELGSGIKRLSDNRLDYFGLYLNTTIEERMKFIINNLFNISICPDEVFQYFENKTTKYRLTSAKRVTETGFNETVNEVSLENAKGIWQIFTLLVDQEVANRSLVDSSLATDSGSLLNFLRKICQRPFVELLMDTYGDRFYMIVRKPPRTYESYNSLREIAIDVYEEDVYSESLQFDDSEIYSWYRLIPQGNYMGEANRVSYYDFPAVFFKEYAEIWGSRPYEVVSNYIDYKGIDGQQHEANFDYLREQALNDLEFLVESTAYNPFVRKGQITIRGDRRIKRGMALRYHPTGEVFIVESVMQAYNINMGGNDRITTVTLSNGMVEAHFEKYFKVINFEYYNTTKVRTVYEDLSFKARINFDSDMDYMIVLNDPNQNAVTRSTSQATRRRLLSESIEDIQKIITQLDNHPELQIEIQGHTDSDPAPNWNAKVGRNDGDNGNIHLSGFRAAFVRKFIVDIMCNTDVNGIGKPVSYPSYSGDPNMNFKVSRKYTNAEISNRIDAVGYGSRLPVATNADTDGKAQNRRIFVKAKQAVVSKTIETNVKLINWSVNKDYFNFFIKRKQFCEC